MNELINMMLANAQLPQTAQPVKKGDSLSKDGFQKLLEQKQSTDSPAPKQEKAGAPEQPQDTQNPQKAGAAGTKEQPQETEVLEEDIKILEDQMTLAAMLMMQNPVVNVEDTEAAAEAATEITLEVQNIAAAEETVSAAMETGLAEEVQTAPQAEETFELPVQSGETQKADASLAEELPQTIEAPEASAQTEDQVQVKVEVGGEGSQSQAVETDAGTEDTPELQDVETGHAVFEDVKTVPVKVGEAPKAEKPAPVEEQIAPKIMEALGNGDTRVEIQLTPENLGKITVEMTLSKDGNLVVQLHAQNKETQNLLSKNATGLEALLGREVEEKVHVEVPRQEESQRQDLYEQQQQQHRQQQQEQRRQQETLSGEDFLQQLRLGLIPLDGE